MANITRRDVACYALGVFTAVAAGQWIAVLERLTYIERFLSQLPLMRG